MEVKELYTNSAARYAGPKKLKWISGPGGPSLRTIQDFLQAQESYSLSKPIRRKFKRSTIVTVGIGDQVQADLLDMVKYRDKKANRNFRFILTLVDEFSRKAWAVPLRTKQKGEVAKAIASALDGYPLKNFSSDQGLEFKNSEVRKYLKGRKVKQFFLKSYVKGSFVERFNLTLRQRLLRAMKDLNNRSWADLLPTILLAYNETPHRATGFAPNSVNKENEADVWVAQYIHRRKVGKLRPFKFRIGEVVRRAEKKTTFERAVDSHWSSTLYTVYNRFRDVGPVNKYWIRELEGQHDSVARYEAELQRVILPSKDEDLNTD